MSVDDVILVITVTNPGFPYCPLLICGSVSIIKKYNQTVDRQVDKKCSRDISDYLSSYLFSFFTASIPGSLSALEGPGFKRRPVSGPGKGSGRLHRQA